MTKCPKNHSIKLYPAKIHQALKEFIEHNKEQNQIDLYAPVSKYIIHLIQD